MGCSGSSAIKDKDTINEKIVLGYWAAHLQGQPSRYVLELAGIPYEDRVYTMQNRADWFEKDKQTLGFDYPNLPYLIHGDFKITESQNVVNYVIEVTNQQKLLGEGKDKYRVGHVRYVCQELIGKLFGAIRNENAEEKQKTIQNDVLPKARLVQTYLGSQNKFCNDLTIADIYAYVFFFNLKKKAPEAYAEFAAQIDPLLQNFESIPNIKKYQESERFAKVNN
ncbi:hypothetical protein ABPG74_019097 [Tetrahymena malaccensis]